MSEALVIIIEDDASRDGEPMLARPEGDQSGRQLPDRSVSEEVTGMASPGGDKDIGSADVPLFGDAGSGQATGGLSWSWELDLSAVVEALTGPAPWLLSADEDKPAPADPVPATDLEPAVDPGPATDPHRPAGPPSATDQPPGTDLRTDSPPDSDLPPRTDPPLATDVDEAACQEAIAAWREDEVPLNVVAGRVAESLPVGPG